MERAKVTSGASERASRRAIDGFSANRASATSRGGFYAGEELTTSASDAFFESFERIGVDPAVARGVATQCATAVALFAAGSFALGLVDGVSETFLSDLGTVRTSSSASVQSRNIVSRSLFARTRREFRVGRLLSNDSICQRF